MKRAHSSRTKQRTKNLNIDNNVATFSDFKNFVRPSTSAATICPQVKLFQSPNRDKNLGARFINDFSEINLQDVKTYKDIKADRHMGPLEINYKYNTEDFYEQKTMKVPTTASQSQTMRRRALQKKGKIHTSKGFRTKINTNQQNSPKMYSPKRSILRSSSTGNLVESIPSKRPMTQGNQFPEDFCIENSLVRSITKS